MFEPNNLFLISQVIGIEWQPFTPSFFFVKDVTQYCFTPHIYPINLTSSQTQALPSTHEPELDI